MPIDSSNRSCISSRTPPERPPYKSPNSLYATICGYISLSGHFIRGASGYFRGQRTAVDSEPQPDCDANFIWLRMAVAMKKSRHPESSQALSIATGKGYCSFLKAQMANPYVTLLSIFHIIINYALNLTVNRFFISFYPCRDREVSSSSASPIFRVATASIVPSRIRR
jgi:hypothetical protein